MEEAQMEFHEDGTTEKLAYLRWLERYDRMFDKWLSTFETSIVVTIGLTVAAKFGVVPVAASCVFLVVSVVSILFATLYMHKINSLDECYEQLSQKKPKVVGWCRYSDEYADWFYGTKHTEQECADAEQAVVDEIRKNGYKFGGYYHQNGEFGCPVMDNGMVYMVSFRSWGDIMSRVWGGEYVDYAWVDKLGKVPEEGFPTDLIKRSEETKQVDTQQTTQTSANNMPEVALTTEEEKRRDEEHIAYDPIVKRCPILFRNTTPFGIGVGWKDIIDDLSSKIEMLNLTAGVKCRFEVVASQVKEKFGTIRFYYDILPKTTFVRRILSTPFILMFSPRGVNKYSCYFHQTICRMIAPLYDFGVWIRFGGKKYVHYRSMAETIVERWVDEAEARSGDTCIDCGKNLSPLSGSYASPRCEMQGWVNYVCPECANKRGQSYMYSLTAQERLWAKEYLGGRCHLFSSAWEDALSLEGKVLRGGKVIESREVAAVPSEKSSGGAGVDTKPTARKTAKPSSMKSGKTTGKRTRKQAKSKKVDTKHEG